MEAYIYMIQMNDMIYIGSTNDMMQRQRIHNYNLKYGRNYQIYNYCRENDINQIELILLECVDIDDRFIVEQYYIDEYKTGHKLLNEKNCMFDVKAYRKTYREANQDKINEKQRLRRAKKKAESN